MTTPYKIRMARDTDKPRIHKLIRETIAREKQLLNPSMVPGGFMEEFVDKVIKKGNMLVVVNKQDELELIGEVHHYHPSGKPEDVFGTKSVKEIAFFSKTVPATSQADETSLVTWLFGEIESNYKDVFRVKLNTPVCRHSTVDFFVQMGLTIEGSYKGRLKNNLDSFRPIVPLSWTNPSFN